LVESKKFSVANKSMQYKNDWGSCKIYFLIKNKKLPLSRTDLFFTKPLALMKNLELVPAISVFGITKPF
jgi:hypothetical protein